MFNFTKQPVTQSPLVGDSFSIDASVGGYSGSTVFNLYKNGSLFDTQTKTDGSYALVDISDLGDNGDYYLTATNAGTTITSGLFSINPQDVKPMSNYGEYAWIF